MGGNTDSIVYLSSVIQTNVINSKGLNTFASHCVLSYVHALTQGCV